MIERFEDIVTLRNQICSAALSVPSNIAEGYERNHFPECLNFLRYAKASCAEVKSQFYIAFDIGYIDEAELSSFLRQADEVSGLIRKFSQSIEKRLATRRSARRPLGPSAPQDDVPRKS